MFAIYKRELKSYFTSPIGYIYLAAFLAISGFSFSYNTVQAVLSGGKTNVESYFTLLLVMMAILIPLLTMKSFSEERKMKTEQLLITSPVTLPGMVMAKFLSAFTVFGGSYLITCLYYVVLYSYQPDAIVAANLTPRLLGYSVAVLLLGAAFVAVGIFVSSLTENQIIAAIGTILILLVALLCSVFNSFINSPVIRTVLDWVSLFSRFSNFTYGVFDFASLLYYISIAFVFLFLTVRVYEKRRWN